MCSYMQNHYSLEFINQLKINGFYYESQDSYINKLTLLQKSIKNHKNTDKTEKKGSADFIKDDSGRKTRRLEEIVRGSGCGWKSTLSNMNTDTDTDTDTDTNMDAVVRAKKDPIYMTQKQNLRLNQNQEYSFIQSRRKILFFKRDNKSPTKNTHTQYKKDKYRNDKINNSKIYNFTKQNCSDKDKSVINIETNNEFVKNNIIYNLRLYLNKITDKSFEENKKNIIECLKLIELKVDKNDINNFQTTICENIFNIISKNIFYSNIYALLYSNLIHEFSFFKLYLDLKFDDFTHALQDIDVNIHKQNYEELCMMNKKLDELKSITTFFVNLNVYNIITYDKCLLLLKNICILVHKNKNNEFIQNIYIDHISIIFSFLTKLESQQNNTQQNNTQINHIKLLNEERQPFLIDDITITKFLHNFINENNISNKLKFKIMDILHI